MQSFVEHRKQTIQEAIQGLSAREGFERQFDILRLDLLDNLRLPEVICEHEDVFVEAELRNLIDQDYEIMREFTENAIFYYKNNAYRQLIHEAAATLAKSPMTADQFHSQLIGMIDNGIQGIQRDFKDILGGREQGIEDAEAEYGSTIDVGSDIPAEAPSPEEEPAAEEPSPETERPNVLRVNPPRSRAGDPAPPRAAGAPDIDISPRQKGERGRNWGGSSSIDVAPSYIRERKPRERKPSAMRPPGGWGRALGRIGSGLYGGLRDKIKGGAKKIGDWWMNRPATESVETLQQIFLENGAGLLQSIVSFSDDLKQFVDKNFPAVIQDIQAAGGAIDPEAGEEEVPARTGIVPATEKDTGAPDSADQDSIQNVIASDDTEQAIDDLRNKNPELAKEAEIDAREAYKLVAALMGGTYNPMTAKGTASPRKKTLDARDIVHAGGQTGTFMNLLKGRGKKSAREFEGMLYHAGLTEDELDAAFPAIEEEKGHAAKAKRMAKGIGALASTAMKQLGITAEDLIPEEGNEEDAQMAKEELKLAMKKAAITKARKVREVGMPVMQTNLGEEPKKPIDRPAPPQASAGAQPPAKGITPMERDPGASTESTLDATGLDATGMKSRYGKHADDLIRSFIEKHFEKEWDILKLDPTAIEDKFNSFFASKSVDQALSFFDKIATEHRGWKPEVGTEKPATATAVADEEEPATATAVADEEEPAAKTEEAPVAENPAELENQLSAAYDSENDDAAATALANAINSGTVDKSDALEILGSTHAGRGMKDSRDYIVSKLLEKGISAEPDDEPPLKKKSGLKPGLLDKLGIATGSKALAEPDDVVPPDTSSPNIEGPEDAAHNVEEPAAVEPEDVATADVERPAPDDENELKVAPKPSSELSPDAQPDLIKAKEEIEGFLNNVNFASDEEKQEVIDMAMDDAAEQKGTGDGVINPRQALARPMAELQHQKWDANLKGWVGIGRGSKKKEVAPEVPVAPEAEVVPAPDVDVAPEPAVAPTVDVAPEETSDIESRVNDMLKATAEQGAFDLDRSDMDWVKSAVLKDLEQQGSDDVVGSMKKALEPYFDVDREWNPEYNVWSPVKGGGEAKSSVDVEEAEWGEEEEEEEESQEEWAEKARSAEVDDGLNNLDIWRNALKRKSKNARQRATEETGVDMGDVDLKDLNTQRRDQWMDFVDGLGFPIKQLQPVSKTDKFTGETTTTSAEQEWESLKKSAWGRGGSSTQDALERLIGEFQERVLSQEEPYDEPEGYDDEDEGDDERFYRDVDNMKGETFSQSVDHLLNKIHEKVTA